ncbi:MAG: helix-turn-helix domain-containing protein [Ktedonobacteraceae bacterium]|nr:helix-turn-helix domain-containing protein [Ktedonobacteraceae bacterium]
MTYPSLLTIGQVASRLRVDPTTVRRWIERGALVAICLPHRGKRKRYRVASTTLETLLQETRLQSLSPHAERSGPSC